MPKKYGKRTYKRVKNRGLLPGLGDAERIDVTGFDNPQRFKPEGKPRTDDFWLTDTSWRRLGEPDRIEVRVYALPPS